MSPCIRACYCIIVLASTILPAACYFSDTEVSIGTNMEKDFQDERARIDNVYTSNMKTIEDQEQKKIQACKDAVRKTIQATSPSNKSEDTRKCELQLEDHIKIIPAAWLRNKIREFLNGYCKKSSNSPVVPVDSRRLDSLEGACEVLKETEPINTKKIHKFGYQDLSGCLRDYTAVCPEGWFDIGDSRTCEAPDSYTGPCSTVITSRTSKVKKSIEKSCGILWPCAKTCEYDLQAKCPVDWEALDATRCRAPSTYNGNCDRVIDFSNYSETDKERWAIVCRTAWPCKTEADCKHDYTVNCPLGWTDIGSGMCDAPSNYVGNCNKRQSIGLFGESMKKAFEVKCSTRFPCEIDCDRDFTAICPTGWIMKEAGTICHPPASYHGSCGDTDFWSMDRREKEKFQDVCHVKWPCKQNCTRDFSSQCPLEWIEKDGACKAPSTYVGGCGNRLLLESYTDEMKKEIQVKCKGFNCLNLWNLTLLRF